MTIRREQPRLGTRKLYHLLKDEFMKDQIAIGRDKLFALLRERGLCIRRRRKYIKTTDSKHWMRTYPDRIKELSLTRPEQLWVADITYLSTEQRTMYLHVVTDAYSKQIMGYTLSNDLKAESTHHALQMAINNRRYPDQLLIHHSDRGLQYCSHLYTAELKTHGCEISMTQDGSPYDNAVAERVNGILKDEFYCDVKFETEERARQHVAESIDIYNTKRPHLSCSMLTPVQMHQQCVIPVKRWHKKPPL